MRKSWFLAVLLAGCAAEASGRVAEERLPAGPAPRGDALLQRTMLTMHNAERAGARQAALTWDAGLAADALVHARDMARNRRLEHSPQPRGNPAQGENLWSGTRAAYRYEEMAQDWIDEKRRLVKQPARNLGTAGDDRTGGHYTQIVWPRTTRFGCATAANATDEYLVCRYLPAGDVVGERALP